MVALVPLLASLVPEVAGWLFGSKAEDVAKTASDIAQQVFGTNDPDAIQTAIATDPQKALDLKMALIKAQSDSEQRDHEEILARIGDVASARAQTVSLAANKSPIAWGAAVISAIIILTFGSVLYLILTKSVPDGQEGLANIMLGALTTMATGVANYWLGSSAGSAQKTQIMGQTASITASQPAPVSVSSVTTNAK